MSTVTIEERVAKLEGLVDELRDRRASADTPGRDDWRGTVGMFANDDVMQEILDTDHLSVLQRPKTPAAVAPSRKTAHVRLWSRV